MSGRQYLSGAAKRKQRSENEMKRALEELGWQQGFPSQFAYVSNNIVSNSFRVLMNNIIK